METLLIYSRYYYRVLFRKEKHDSTRIQIDKNIILIIMFIISRRDIPNASKR